MLTVSVRVLAAVSLLLRCIPSTPLWHPFPCFQAPVSSLHAAPHYRATGRWGRHVARARGGDSEDGPEYHDVPLGGPGSDLWRGIPLDRRKLIEERAQNRNSEVRIKGPTGTPRQPSMPSRSRRETAENFFGDTHRRGRGPQQRGDDFFAGVPNPRSRDDRRSLRPTRANTRPGGTKIEDGLRTSTRSFFDDEHSLDPRRALLPRSPVEGARGGGGAFPPGYSAPLSGFSPPVPSSRTPSSTTVPTFNPFGQRERKSAASARLHAAATTPLTAPTPTPTTSSPLPTTATTTATGRERAGGQAGLWDSREGEQLVASLKSGDRVVHAQHGVCRFRGIENVKVGALSHTYLVLEFADGKLCEQASNAPMALTRYFGSGRGYRKSKSSADDHSVDAEEEEEEGPPLDYLSRPEIWKKRKSKAVRAIRKLATDVVKLQALRSSKCRRPYPLSDGGTLSSHVLTKSEKHQALVSNALRRRGTEGGGGEKGGDISVQEEVEAARAEMRKLGFDDATVARALKLSEFDAGKTTTAAAVAADLEATGGTMTRREAFEAGFPYILTPDQALAIQSIQSDMCDSNTPMDRLVCGDVGFGKTEVALRAILTCVMDGRQAIFMAPTTVLAAQHFRNVEARFGSIGFRVALLSRYTPAKEKKEIMAQIESGDVDIIVGTHALLAPKIVFGDLGLVVVDEEQRFGVNQKEKLKALAVGVDVLTLSATPIPRTLQLAMSGLREMSTILSPPPMRRQIETHIAPAKDDVVLNALERELARGGQCYCVVPRIADTEKVASMVTTLVPTARVIVANGQQKDVEDRLMQFSDGYADILLCTPIIESGLDLPAVNTIIVFEAQRFGLSSLYQLRGRVGRGALQAYALFTFPPGTELSAESTQRLDALQEFGVLGSGYQLAQRDLEIRGAGSLLGADQSGEANDVGVQLYMKMLREVVAGGCVFI